jgi:hemolysin activation/secretion protein/AraC-like DNA-binding protein
MAIERHLILQELTLRPSGEWTPSERGWVVARATEGVGYWLPGGSARELNAGDGFVAGFNANTVVRASQLGPLKLQFFTVQPQYLGGLLTMAEWHQLESAAENPLTRVLFFTAGEPFGQKFSRIAAQTPADGLTMRCALLQLWTSAVASLIGSLSASAGGNRLRERFRQLVGQMPEARLSECSLSGLAAQLHCSERHFSRLFREEFGVPFRARQAELRLQHARQLLASSDAKIINVAHDSGYHHVGLFNSMFKKRFGITPSEWRQQNIRKDVPTQHRNRFSWFPGRVGVLLAMLGLHFISPVIAQTNPVAAAHYEAAPTNAAAAKPVHSTTASTNAGPRFEVEKYLVMGNTILSPAIIGQVITNADGAFGTNVTFDGIRTTMTELQKAYRERGYVTVSVGLPRQKLTNATVKLQVTEGQLAVINVTGNRYYSSNNVMRALPSLHTNMLLNSHVFQRELDNANVSRDRQIYPVISPGPEPGTSELMLKVKDRLPLHTRLELNNQFTPGTPDLRANFSAQYDNLWDLEHQVGLQYSCAFQKFKNENDYSATPLDDPLIANYSAYYRLPLGGYSSVQEQVDAHPGSFGYSEVTHRFNLPSATGRPELTVYASRSTSDTGVQRGPQDFLADETATNSSGDIFHPLSIVTNSAGDNVTLNEDLGAKLTLPLPQLGKITASLSFGADFKRYQQASYNTNENAFETQYYDQQGGLHVDDFAAPQPQTAIHSALDYFPLNIGLNGSVPDGFGTTFFNAQANFNILPIFSEETKSTYITNITATATNVVTQTGNAYGHSFSDIGYANARNHYVTLQFGADRVQTIYKNWSVKLHADGQWANGALFSNEQYAMGGMAGVRGYTDGQAYGDTGWRFSIEPQTPLVNIGMVDGDVPFWVRASVFMDYGQLYLLDGNHFAQFTSFNGFPAGNIPNSPSRLDFWGVGWGITANIGSHCDARLTMAFPLIDPARRAGFSPEHNLHIYFGVGAQF